MILISEIVALLCLTTDDDKNDVPFLKQFIFFLHLPHAVQDLTTLL
jgi:hypothetical protein